MIDTGELEQVNWLEMLYNLKRRRSERMRVRITTIHTSQNTSLGSSVIGYNFPISLFCTLLLREAVRERFVAAVIPLEFGPGVRDSRRPSHS